MFMPCLCSPAFLQSGKQNPVSYKQTDRQPTAPRSSSSSPPTLPRKGYPKATWRQTLFRWSPGINQLLPVLPGLSRGKPRATAQGARGRRARSAFGRRRGLRSRRPAPTGSNPRSRLRSGRKEELGPIDGPGRDREGQLRGPQKPIRAGRHPTPSRSRWARSARYRCPPARVHMGPPRRPPSSPGSNSGVFRPGPRAASLSSGSQGSGQAGGGGPFRGCCGAEARERPGGSAACVVTKQAAEMKGSAGASPLPRARGGPWVAGAGLPAAD